MSELLSKEVEAIAREADQKLQASDGMFEEDLEIVRSALRSVLFLAANEMCQICRHGDIPSPCGTSLFHPVSLDGESIAECAAAPIHKMLRGEK